MDVRLRGWVDSEGAAKLLGLSIGNFRIKVHRGEIEVGIRIGRTPLFEKVEMRKLRRHWNAVAKRSAKKKAGIKVPRARKVK